MAPLTNTRFGQSPLGQLLASRSNALMAFGGNIDGDARSFAQALQPGFKAAIAGRQLDSESARLAAEQAAREAEIAQSQQEQNATIAWIRQRAAEDARFAPYAQMADAGIPPSEWWGPAMQLMAPQEGPTPTDDINEYNFYRQQELAAGRQPVSFDEWQHPTPGQFRQLTAEEIAADPRLDQTKAYQVGPDNRIYEIGGGGTNVDVSVGGGSDDFYGALDAAGGKGFATLIDNGYQAQRAQIQLGQLEALLGSFESGAGASLQAMAGTLGIPSEGLSEIQAAEAIISQLVPQQRPPGSGPMSDADLALFKRSLPSIINQPGGNALILQTMKAINDYTIAQAEIAARVASRELTPEEGRAALNALPDPLAASRQFTTGATPAGVVSYEEYFR